MVTGLQKTLQEMSCRAPSWLEAAGGEEECVVISTRARLARNLRGRTFPGHASENEGEELLQLAWEICSSLEPLAGTVKIPMLELTWEDRRFLVERYMISPALAEAEWPRGVAVSPDESLTAMINEEDHFRFHHVVPGLAPQEAWSGLESVADAVGRMVTYAFREPYGFLTASPTNVGTGLRISLLLHLPALVLTNEVEHVLRRTTQLGMQVRGVYGEGSAVFGNFFQLSNQLTLGRSEEDIFGSLAGAGAQVTNYEMDAREMLWREARIQMEDKIERALGLLRCARILSLRESMNLLSAVRLGVNMGVLSGVDISRLNRLTILAQPSHLDRREGRVLDPSERDILRADLIRSYLT